MLYDIYFHNDFDGRASAAVMLSFLRSRGDDIEHFTPIDFDLQPQWVREDFFKKHKLFKGKRNPAIVVDFFYHPKAAFWFDHHPTTFKKETWRKKFKRSKFHNLDPQYPSCCHFVYASLKNNFGWKPPKLLRDLVTWMDVIDGAQYRSARQTLELKEPALEVDAFIDSKRHEPSTQKPLVEMLASRPLADIARLSEVQKVAQLTRKKHAEALLFYRRHIKTFATGTLIDLTKTDLQMLRFGAYYLFPKLRYGIRFVKSDGVYRVGIGSNPWLSQSGGVHLGKLLAKYGGGGHKGAAATRFVNRKDAEKAIQEMIATLSKRK